MTDQSGASHVWYSAEHDEIKIVDDLQHWYWHWFCTQVRHIVYLGEL